VEMIAVAELVMLEKMVLVMALTAGMEAATVQAVVT